MRVFTYSPIYETFEIASQTLTTKLLLTVVFIIYQNNKQTEVLRLYGGEV